MYILLQSESMAFKSIFKASLKYVRIIHVTPSDEVKHSAAKVGHVSNLQESITPYIYLHSFTQW